MSAYTDFVAFVDGGSIVPYFVTGAKYVQKPNNVHTHFSYDFKDYYKSYNSYYVGVGFSQFVRPIHAKDFQTMFNLYEEREKLSVKKHTQLVFDL